MGKGKKWNRDLVLDWYEKSSFFNHSNFTNMLKFTMNDGDKGKELDILEFGGGGRQIALICKSQFPRSNVT